jgi:serine/threonine-protein kinase
MTSEHWRQVEQLYHAALEQEEGQRAAFLQEACAGNEVLLREVESLLECRPKVKSFIEAPALELAARALAEDRGASLLGQLLGPYKILSVLGVGGMGEVFLAQDTRLGRKVALKLLPGQFAQEQERVRRLEREAQAISNLSHPHICAFYDIGHQGGVVFLVMEYLEGETLAQRLKKVPFPSIRSCAARARSLARWPKLTGTGWCTGI